MSSVACTKLADANEGRCNVTAFRRFANATNEVTGAQDGILQILGTGPCYTMMDTGVPQNQRLLRVTDELESALSDQYAPPKLLNQWQQALSIDLATRARTCPRK